MRECQIGQFVVQTHLKEGGRSLKTWESYFILEHLLIIPVSGSPLIHTGGLWRVQVERFNDDGTLDGRLRLVTWSTLTFYNWKFCDFPLSWTHHSTLHRTFYFFLWILIRFENLGGENLKARACDRHSVTGIPALLGRLQPWFRFGLVEFGDYALAFVFCLLFMQFHLLYHLWFIYSWGGVLYAPLLMGVSADARRLYVSRKNRRRRNFTRSYQRM